ncbi:hypothetical protein [Streptomyces katsurahamanus]|uniref:Sensor domain-containing protein n=1 Tax=Streptomyces katsurahamanus TaxID=2577098 RepID=A0ABW9NSI2_9ACTN|nr:hypothetical protein [Streptomyces katsurahamanus]MQS36205.1 hypothetical protein [Streptomyces katsurahamanus]
MCLAAALASLIALTGCGGESGTEDDEPRIGPVPVVRVGTAGTALQLPLHDYLFSQRQLRELDRARFLLLDRCTRRFGFPYPAPAYSGTGPTSLAGRRYGVYDAQQAKAYGYGIAGNHQPPERKELPPERKYVVFGEGASPATGRKVPEGGCLGLANRQLTGGSTGQADSFPQLLSSESFQRSREDSRTRKAFGAWSACMAQRGYAYDNPFAPARDKRLRADGKAKEIRVAVADIACKEKTNLVGIWYAVESAYQRQSIRKNAATLTSAKATIKRNMWTAASVLASR